MDYSEEEIERLEDSVPERAVQAVKAACERTLNAGHSIVGVVNGTLYRMNPDRTMVAIKTMPAEIKIAKGTKFKLK